MSCSMFQCTPSPRKIETIYVELESKCCCLLVHLLAESGPTTSIEQPQKHEFPVTSVEWKFEICSTTFVQGGGFGKTIGIQIHKWSLLPRHRQLPEQELAMRFLYPWKALCKRRASRKDQLY